MVAQVDPDDKPLSMDGKILLKTGQAAIYPLWWTETATSNLQTRFKDRTNEVEDVVAGLPEESFLDAILEKVRQACNAPGYFEKMDIATKARGAMQWHNDEIAADRRRKGAKP
eukprot:14285569-Alexandrium_andersonii.AAC.1